jgi:hypothetical protein
MRRCKKKVLENTGFIIYIREGNWETNIIMCIQRYIYITVGLFLYTQMYTMYILT